MAQDELPHPYRPLAEEAILQALLEEPAVQETLRALRERCPLVVGKPPSREAYREASSILAAGESPAGVVEALHPPELEGWTWREVEDVARYRLLPGRLRPYLASLHPLAQVGYLAAAYRQARLARVLTLALAKRYRHALGKDWGPEALWWTISRGVAMPTPMPLPLDRLPWPGRGPRPSRKGRVRQALRLLRKLHEARLPRRWTELAGVLVRWPWLTGRGDRLRERWELRVIASLQRILGLQPRPRGRPRKKV